MIWLIGHQGMLGREVAKLLASHNLPYLGTGREVDIAALEQVESFVAKHQAINVLINCAAMTAVDKCEQEPEAAMAINGLGPKHLATVAVRLGAVLCHVSTDYVFDGQQQVPYSEQDGTSPICVYGSSKLAGEQAIAQIMEQAWQAGQVGRNGQFARALIVRTSWLFGCQGSNFVQTMERLISEREQLQVVADQHGCPTYAPDLAAAMWALVGSEQQQPVATEIFHYSNSQATTWFGFAEQIRQLVSVRQQAVRCQQIGAIATSQYPTPARRPAYSVLSTKKISQRLGTAPRSWQTALEAYFGERYGTAGASCAAKQS